MGLIWGITVPLELLNNTTVPLSGASDSSRKGTDWTEACVFPVYQCTSDANRTWRPSTLLNECSETEVYKAIIYVICYRNSRLQNADLSAYGTSKQTRQTLTEFAGATSDDVFVRQILETIGRKKLSVLLCTFRLIMNLSRRSESDQ